MNVSLKWKTFVWRLMHKALATSSNLRIRRVLLKEECHTCGKEKETQSHLFKDYEVIK